jgi:filamentous hemagglutinin family protein
MRLNYLPYWVVGCLPLCLLAVTNPTRAQIIPDQTLSVNSAVTSQGNTKVINGGTVAGSNLFHSFQEFSVGTGESAYFNNSLNIQNIVTRVTGKSISNIDGLLKADGNANLFLLNPNGIIFGRNSTLDIGGSFVASTANSLKFTDGGEFSAINPQSTSLLSITMPLGLQFPGMPASIINRSANLQVSSGKTIALVGGDISLESGKLAASQGRVELSSVSGESLVSLHPTANGWSLGYDGINNFGNIQLLTESKVSADNGGDISIRANDLTVTNGSAISANTSTTANGGQVTIQANKVEVSGASANGQIFSTIAATSTGSGNSGNIEITTNRLITKEGGDVSVKTVDSGKGGNLTVNASESIELIGTVSIPNSTIFSRSGFFAATEGIGDGGNITINTPLLQVLDGARVSVSTRGAGKDGITGGKGGLLTVNAAMIDLSGTSADGRFISGLFALSGEERPNIKETDATGNGGNIKIETSQLNISNGAGLSAATLGVGKGGNITVQADTINIAGASTVSQKFSTLATDSRATGDSGDIKIDTKQLRVSDGADVSVTAFGAGRSGNLTVNATESIELIGASAIPNSTIFSRSGLFAATEGIKDGGSLTVNTSLLIVKDGARISVSTRGKGENGIPGGKGGNLIVNAKEIELSGIGKVQLLRNGQTETRTFPSGLFALSGEIRPNIADNEATGAGGNLEINTDLLTVRDGAEVSVTAKGAGIAGNLVTKANGIRLQDGSIIGATVQGSGANITLEVRDSLQLRGNSQISTTAGENGDGGNIKITADTLAILENSSISADAGRQGGNVQITTKGIFSLPNAITASSAQGAQFSGNVLINTPDIQPTQGLIAPPEKFLSPENQVASACASEKGQNRSQFIITGRGGLPPDPTEPLSSETVRVSSSKLSSDHNSITSVQLPQPATGWGVNHKGELILIANTANLPGQSSQIPSANCHVH